MANAILALAGRRQEDKDGNNKKKIAQAANNIINQYVKNTYPAFSPETPYSPHHGQNTFPQIRPAPNVL
jgi:hypothetical protein